MTFHELPERAKRFAMTLGASGARGLVSAEDLARDADLLLQDPEPGDPVEEVAALLAASGFMCGRRSNPEPPHQLIHSPHEGDEDCAHRLARLMVEAAAR
jgi:hypothetical protein